MHSDGTPDALGPAQGYYSVNVLGMSVGGERLELGCGDYNAPSSSIVDSGTTNLIVPHKVGGRAVGRAGGRANRLSGGLLAAGRPGGRVEEQAGSGSEGAIG